MNLAFELLFSERDHNHSLGENIEKCLIGLDLRPSRRGSIKNIFSVRLPTRRGVAREGICKWLICGGPCRGRTYGPLIKREKAPFFTTLAVATVSPQLVAISVA